MLARIRSSKEAALRTPTIRLRDAATLVAATLVQGECGPLFWISLAL
ncbi:hypothetical protein USDA257_c11800 [Sinorhizobium fredii USDA 257]|uniref:Uncharacterized protein n=1 Tax=Sinorhizobium fredii (strain USDA 257) TaxID=1185652 RepID=I3X1L5_SINF2|nr:hypothetical protein USDA257_c11800 [Sinorhizobium fredii USDA 257]